MEEQLTLFEIPAPERPRVWSMLSTEERSLVVSMLAHLMARIVADLGDYCVPQEGSHD